MEGMEKKVTEIIEIETSQGKLALNIGGTIDRIDSKDDTLRIVDYKQEVVQRHPKTSSSYSHLPTDVRITFFRLSCMLLLCAASSH